MIKIKYTLILLASLSVLSVSAKEVTKEIKAEQVKVEKIGSEVRVSFETDIPQNAVKRNYKLTLVPVLYNGNRDRSMKPIVVESRRTKIVDERTGKLPLSDAYHTANGSRVAYITTVPYQSWMNGSSLRLDKFVEGCCTTNQLPGEMLVSNNKLVKELVPSIEKRVALVPKIEQIAKRWDFDSRDMIIDFVVNKTQIDQSLYQNQQTLKDIVLTAEQIAKDDNKQINKIEISGYASPEGSEKYNSYLAEQRALALRDYLQGKVRSLKSADFTIVNGGENWQGLRNMVAASDMSYKGEVLTIIDNVPAAINYRENTSRMKQLMDLKGGSPYNYMLKNFFPRLRTACYIVVYYDVLGDSAADAINESISLIEAKKYEQALLKLLPYKNDSRAWNPIGVCYMMSERTAEAKEYLQKAIAEGNVQARENLEQIIQ